MSKENDTMNLEFLPNEIFLDLFDYFDGTDLLRAFYGLNSRFNLLLYKQFRSYRFRFDFVSKRHFDLIYQQHLPFIVDQVITLQLSDHWETPEQISLFLSYIPSVRQFTHLRSLTLSHLRSYKIMLTLLYDCQYLSQLTHLKFHSCSFSKSSVEYQLIINKIWSLTKLTNCYFDTDIDRSQDFCMPTIISTSLECVTLFHHKLQWSELNQLLEYTTRLKHLSTFIEDSMNDPYITYSHPALVRLKIWFYSSIDLSTMVDLFQRIPNLRHLDFCTSYQLIDGHQWEEIIHHHLLQLKTLRLKMVEAFYHGENIQREADKLLDSFRSSFWIDEHQWFIRCITWDRRIQLETLSSASDYYKDTNPNSWQSTDPHDTEQDFYKNIIDIYDQWFFNQKISSNIHLPNIRYLRIKLPINDQFWSIVSNLNQLKTLSIASHADTFQSQLQTLLDRAPHLATLKIRQDASLPLQMSLFKYTNAAVQRLNLSECNHIFNEEECIALTHSSLGVQCEALSIWVNNRKSVVDLVNNIPNLRALSVKCADDEYDKRSILTENNDEVIPWLKDHLSSTYSIVRDPEIYINIIIWM